MTMRLVLRAVLSAAAFVFLVSTAQAATEIGKVVAVAGSPTASGPGGDRKLSAGSAVFEDDKVTVGGAGNAQIILNDNTRLVVGPGSALVLDRFLMKGGSSAQKVAIKTLRGTFRFITGKSPKSAYQISTSSATIGIRGTGFDFSDKSRTSVAVMDGTVSLCDKLSKKDCVELTETCEVGYAGSGDSAEQTGADAGTTIINNLPYVLNQSPLRTQFHLKTNRCSSNVSKAMKKAANPGGSNQNKPRSGDGQKKGNRDECPMYECG